MNRINKRRNHCQFGDDPFAVTLHKSAEMSRKTLVWHLHTCILNPLGVFPLIRNKRVKVPKEHSPSFRERGMFLLTKGIEIATTSGMTHYTSIHDL